MKVLLVRFTLFFTGIIILGAFIRFTPEELEMMAEFSSGRQKIDPPFLNEGKNWVDSVYNRMTDEEKIGQMLMIAAYPGQGESHFSNVENLITEQHVGGIIFFRGEPFTQAQLTNRFQSKSKIPLLIAIDGEWGLSMRLENTVQYPYQMMLGAIQNERLIYNMGADIASQLKRMGVHINFAPVTDINNNPRNPVINMRSFGEDRYNVTRKSIHYMMGMQDKNIIAVAKHFPGHGDTDTDSHLKLPLILHEKSRLDSIEFFPFREIIKSGVGGIMVAHLNIPAIDSTPGIASSLSQPVIDSLLKDELGFKGLVFTDAMNMGGITEQYDPVEANVSAFLAGNDIILMPAEVKKTIDAIKAELEKGSVSYNELESRCKKILAAKYWAGLNRYKPVDLANLGKDLNNPAYRLFNQKLIEASLTVLENKNAILPLKKLDTLKIASVIIGDGKPNAFGEMLNNYLRIKTFYISGNSDSASFFKLIDEVSDYNLVIVGLTGTDIRYTKNYGITQRSVSFIDSIVKTNNVILDLFANPYSLSFFKNLKSSKGLIVSYDDNELVQKISAQLIFGTVSAQGKIPVSASETYPLRSGLVTLKLDRLKYSIPLEAGISEDLLYKVDSVTMDAIREMAFPGCEIVAARKGVVFYQKSFGYHTYKNTIPVKNSDLYDLASVTKITASIPAIMKLSEKDLLDLDKEVSKYLPYLDTTNKNAIKIREILLHESRLKPWIPFYLNTLEPIYPSQDISSSKFSDNYPIKISNGYYVNKHLKYKDNYYSSSFSDDFPFKVADNLYINKSIVDTIYAAIAGSELNGREGYKYSDLGYYWLYKIIENITGKSFESFLDSAFYKQIGVSLCFNPLNFCNKDEIVPTENDLIFRKQLVHGYVHDMGAAMLGGVCGHAGLFGNANDLAKIMQLYLNGGEYGSIEYFDERTIRSFTSCKNCSQNRRGLGFDKPETDKTRVSPAAEMATQASFGHTGFTGTMVWADPEYDMVYVFLSNRIYPDAINNKITDSNIRTKIQQVFYEAIIN